MAVGIGLVVYERVGSTHARTGDMDRLNPLNDFAFQKSLGESGSAKMDGGRKEIW
jgi:hypothetical protein